MYNLKDERARNCALALELKLKNIQADYYQQLNCIKHCQMSLILCMCDRDLSEPLHQHPQGPV